jgi:4'-phosphopantetheinyl transferase
MNTTRNPSSLVAERFAARIRRRQPPGLALRLDEVDLWRAELDEQSPETFAALRALLSPDEEERASRFYFERDRRRFVVARGILRTLLGRYLGRAPGALQFRYGPNGKPALVLRAGEVPLHFNVAHSDALAVFAFCRAGEIGIDLERIRPLPEWRQIAAAYFSAQEQARIEACPEEQRAEEFFAAWTRQEAALKAQGVGLAGTSAATTAEPDPALTSRYRVHALQVADGFAAALAVPVGTNRSTCHTWRGTVAPGLVGTRQAASRRVVRRGIQATHAS